MRSLEILVASYPNKTGAEILEIQAQEKSEHEKKEAKYNAKKLAIIKDINENGGYYKGTFGLDQYYYYNFSDLKMYSDGTIVCAIDQIVCFKKENNEVSIERRNRQFENFDNCGVGMCERVTKEDFDKVTSYLNNTFSIFWHLIEQHKK